MNAMYTPNAIEIYPNVVSDIIIRNTNHVDIDVTPKGQRNFKPAIGDVVGHYLDGKALKEALFIIDNILENKMKIKWSAANVWTVMYRHKHVCDLTIKNDSLNIGKVSDVLAKRVKYMRYDLESTRELIAALRDSVSQPRHANYALQ